MTHCEPSIHAIASALPVTAFERAAIEEWVSVAQGSGENPVTCLQNEHCGIFLKGEAAETYGEDLPCLAVFQDTLGNWSALIRRPGRSDSLLTCQFLADRDVR